ncbi:MAG TPA: bifunctional phosphopantothenoylcysteine decarboxylase/phosphopantothenate--cysteine ligase CoaBC [Solirubrobacteraceae bacterium]|jgi:phosphopantothenoylcysteine decarboxylase/phosphopantothenate--cysteine ligase|nr:bifunctional phosphopantothenoylcysteine decarboxylase/phosphopantothenate--cysteine ligase CoaBC [Solirubrobacteraceae bacterium]
MARILLGVSGGIAAYKALELVRLATGAGHAVRVVQTPNSRRFVGEASFAALSGAPVLVSEFERDPMRGAFPGDRPQTHEPLSHLELVANADIFLIAPASANTIAKLATGAAEDLLSSCALAARCPVLVAPAMNNHMYEHAATQANVRTLRERGVQIIEPGVGRLASKGEQGVGRLAEPAQLLAACEAALASSDGDAPDGHEPHAPAGDWDGLRVLVTAGGTREPVDSVRFLGNSSSGRMGLALAEAARARGAEVTLIAANVSLPSSAEIERRDVATAAELEAACREQFASADVLLMAAAVADFRPVAPRADKIKKSELSESGRSGISLELEPTTDVLAALAADRRPGQTLVGFAAEHGERAVELGRRKLVEKGVDAIVVNDISRQDIGFDVDANEVTILTAAQSANGNGTAHASASDGTRKVARAAKAEVARAILDAVAELRASR